MIIGRGKHKEPDHGDMTILEFAMEGGIRVWGWSLVLDRLCIDIIDELVPGFVRGHGE